ILRLDESVTLGRVEPLHSTGRHIDLRRESPARAAHKLRRLRSGRKPIAEASCTFVGGGNAPGECIAVATGDTMQERTSTLGVEACGSGDALPPRPPAPPTKRGKSAGAAPSKGTRRSAIMPTMRKHPHACRACRACRGA